MSASPYEFDVVRPYDPVVVEHNHDRPIQLAEYATFREMPLLALPPDAKPLVFRCKVLTRDQRRAVRELASRESKNELAFRFALLSVRNAQVLLPDGKPTGHMTTITAARARPNDALTEATLDELERHGIGDADIDDIGSAVVARSFLAQSVRPRCVVPAFSQDACLAALRQCAERKTDSPTLTEQESASPPSSEKPKGRRAPKS